ncbi:Terpenoid cyclases/Protein prenyltransferases superfamily protein [Euphorbia peplus]|nr:Terpenoid cyclases/Protein prenyltransferases superfamily protein [Euphorbia peplus]
MGSNKQEDILRGASKNLPKGFWGSTFASFSPLDSELESYTEEVEALKEKVKDMLIQSTKELTYNIDFINLLCRLGLSYHFEDEIDTQLNHIFTTLPSILEHHDYQLSTLATLFRVLRQHGYKMTSDMFKKFKDNDGQFKRSIVDDVKGLICLYEACFLAVHGEHILDEALCFTRKRLETLAENSSPHIKKLIRDALILPCHQNMERFDALHFISFYEADESPNETLLRFAKLDFNRLQLLYRKELALLSTWWKNTNVAKNLPYARDRLAESYLWALGSIFEPQYSLSRMIICKYVQLVTLVDDTYDTYGTMDELKHFTTAIERFPNDGIDKLPQYMKILYECISTIFEETENDVGGKCSHKVSYAREMLKEIVSSYSVEKTWQNDGEAPSFDEYMSIGKVTSTYDLLTSAFIFGMENMGIKEMVWVRNDPPIVAASKLFARLMNDISERKDETKREDFPKAIDCYMKQYGVSRPEAIDSILSLLENKWKDMNEDLLKPTNMSKIMLKYTFNFARMSMLFYGGTDLFTYESASKELITSFIINPLPI